MTKVFGRTNMPMPPAWFQLAADFDDSRTVNIPLGSIVDVSAGTARLGHVLNRRKDLLFAALSGFEMENAPTAQRAGDLMCALLLQIASSIGRPVDLLLFQLRRALRDDQLEGALAGLEEARSEGLVSNVGLSIDGPLFAVLPTWRLNDAFEICLVNRADASLQELATIKALAQERRVGLVFKAEHSSMGVEADLFIQTEVSA